MMDFKEVLYKGLQVFDKNLRLVLLKVKLCETKNKLKNFTKQLLEILRNERCTHVLWTVFGVLILPIFH